ncbi:hypothetical protein EHS25_002686 [Saitozyma podzolica]|uniref:Major facilitator superfamily (MFS) profile domain-containing protein n=1 Tax=Saitozyma podzolica TaxID=1890683 RepID=A0A427YDJ3_9TREE|nr:hypothetical protein EHS25_002686 [Saitozyma podzolica]
MSHTLDDKPVFGHDEGPRTEDIENNAAAKAMDLERVTLTEEDNRRILRKTDLNLLPLLVWVYFLQIYDKTVFGYGNTFGLTKDLNLSGTQYSLASSMTPIAVLAWQPFSSYVIVRFPARYLMTIFVLCWGLSEACMAAVTDYRGLYATRFLLGLFEAGCIPLFSMLTAQWYRRSEQPLRVCAWFVTNSLATIVAALLSYGIGHITNPHFKPWQALYLISGVITVLTAPVVWFRLDSDIATARFWKDDHERDQAIERLRANQTGTGSREFKWAQVAEVLYDPKSWLFGGLICIPNIGAQISNTFGPTLIKDLGFNTYTSTLLNMPFGALQGIAIVAGSYAAYKFKFKSPMLMIEVILGLVGTILLYLANKAATVQQGLALAGYYLLAFLFGVSPIIYAWAIANTGGQTKKSVLLSFMNCLTATGQLTGPLLMASNQAPRYLSGLRSMMIAMGVMIVIVGLQVVAVYLLNKQRQRQRVAAGKPEHIHDTSMDKRFQAIGTDEHDAAIGANALKDLTDFRNDEFVYVY